MKTLGHLLIEEVTLEPGQEWMDPANAWHFLHVSAGAAYWLGGIRPRSLTVGEMLIIPPVDKGVLRASQIGRVTLHAFNFAPDLLCGLFTLSERHYFENGGAAASQTVQFLPSTHPLTERFAAFCQAGFKPESLAQRIEVLSLVAAVFDEEIARHRPPATLGTTALHRFKQIIAQMPDTELVHHSPEQLARLCGCSLRHFNRLFRKFFGASARERQTHLRLLKARQLLSETDQKIIQVALESGYRNLSLFNALFKRRFGMTPSEWRRKSAKRNGKSQFFWGMIAFFLASGVALFAAPPGHTLYLGTPVSPKDMDRAQQALQEKMRDLNFQEERAELFPIPRTNTVAGVSTNGPTFQVKGYDLLGNTLLPPAVTDLIFRPYTGPAVSFDEIRDALADLQLVYRDRGFVTVAVSLPTQQLTNGIVKVQVTEGRLSEINVLNNRYYSSNNVMRALPGLHTNLLLNALLFQRDLDRANANRDRQIYPLISPGPDPGTTILDLKVKDRFPLHGRLEVNNNNTPDSPPLRMNAAAQYNNLWQLDHQLGLQYSFTPQEFKAGDFNAWDEPLIVNYSAYYRMPLSGPNGPRQEYTFTPAHLGYNEDYALQSFGYDEATHRFRPPPPSGADELLVYASRSLSDTGVQQQGEKVTPPGPPVGGELQTFDTLSSRTLNPIEDFGVRFIHPLPEFDGVDSTVSFGLDYKNYRSATAQTRVFQAILWVPEFPGVPNSPLEQFPSPPVFSGQRIFNSIQYVPLSISYNATRPDRFGATALDLGTSFQPGNFLSSSAEFQGVTQNTNTTGRYVTVTAGLTRDQRLFGPLSFRLHADGQWANERLVSSEQFALGGQSSLRGYHEGEQYGDTGWHVQFDLHTDYLNTSMINRNDPDRTMPAPSLLQAYAFVDYGQRYLLDGNFDANPSQASGGGAQPPVATLAGAGFGFNASIGTHVDFRLQLAFALHDSPPLGSSKQPDVRTGDLRVTFVLGTQF